MGSRVILLCLALTRVSGNNDFFFKTGIKAGDQKHSASENIGFTQPLDFSFSQQFFGNGDNVFRPEPLSQTGDFDFFGAESKNSPNLPSSFAKMAFSGRGHNSGYSKPAFSTFTRGADATEIYNVKTVKAPPPPPPPKRDVSNPPPKSEQLRGKSSYPSPYADYKSDHAPRVKSNPVFANSDDIEIFFPPGRTLLPHLNGRPRPYDGYRSVPDSMGLRDDEEEHTYMPAKRHYPLMYPRHRSFDDRRPQSFFNPQVAESRNEETEVDEGSEEDSYEDQNSGYRYQLDDSIEVPDLVIKTYPYERYAFDDRAFTRDHDKYTKSVETDLEDKYGVPDFKFEQYTAEESGDLSKDSNCERIESGSNTCYVCKNPKTGGKYEQCSYEKQPAGKKYSYKSENYSKMKPVKHRYKRSSDDEHGDEEEGGLEYGKRKSKKFSSQGKKKDSKRRPRQNEEGPPPSYNGPSYTYEGPRYSYEGPSSPYEGPSSPYEGPIHDYEGPDHDDYYDKDDRQYGETGSYEPSSRYQQSPKAEVEEFKPTRGSGDYRFGPEFFDDEVKFEKPRSKPRKKVEKVVLEEVDEDTSGKVKVFKNGDVCEKVRRKNLICMVCNNEKTQAKYEQCQYSKKPKSQGYTYGSEKSYSSKKPKNSRPERQLDQDPEISESKFTYTKVERQVFGDDNGETTIVRRQRNAPAVEEVKDEIIKNGADENRRSYTYDDEEEYPDLAGIVDNLGGGSEDVKSFQDTPGGATYQLLGETKGTSKNKLFPQSNETFEQYFSRVFPQFEVFGKLSSSVLGPVADLESLSTLPGLQEKMKMVPGSPTPAPSEGMKDLKMLAMTLGNLPRKIPVPTESARNLENLAQTVKAFQAKDWSKCSKQEFPKMVCYECPTPEGIIHEECMFIDNKVQPTANPSDESTAANILTAVQSAIMSGHMEDSGRSEGALKGDFEGTGGSREVEQFGERKRGKKRKKINWRARQQQQEPSEIEEVVWDDGGEDHGDMSSVKIFFNSTNSH